MSGGMPSFKTYKILDPVIADITSDTDYGVISGCANKTFVATTANSRGNSSLSFVCNIPSQNTLVDRQVLLQVPVQFRVQYKVPTAGQVCEFSYGQNDSFQAFPIASIMTSLQATINNTTVSNEINYSLPALLKVNPLDEVMCYNNMSPCYPDRHYYKYKDANQATNNPLAGLKNGGYNTDCGNGRGSFPVSITRVVYNAGGVAYPVQPVDSVAVADNDLFEFTVSAIVTEPLFCSPFIWSGLHDGQSMAFLGINTIGLNINIDTSYRRLWSTMSDPYGVGAGQYFGIQPGTRANPEFFAGTNYGSVTLKASFPSLLLNYMTSQPSQVLDVRNVIPYMSMESKITISAPAIASGSAVTISSNTFTLNQIPDQILIFAQKKWSSKTASDSNSFLAIKSLNANFNNQAGLLSSASPENLWRMSQKNASNQGWLEFVGQAHGVLAGSLGAGGPIPTTGSMMVVNPALDLSLPDFLSAGSLGQFQFQVEVGVYNQGANLVAGDVELVCLFVNSGILQTEMGMSSLYTGLLDKTLVLETKDASEGIKYSNRVIGGGMDDRMMGSKRRDMMRRMGEKLSGAVKSGRSKLDSLF